MNKPKTEKYYICTYVGDCFKTTIKVNKKEFEEELNKNLNSAMIEKCLNCKDDEGYEHKLQLEEKETFFKKTIIFKYGASEINFIKYETKKGYYFTK